MSKHDIPIGWRREGRWLVKDEPVPLEVSQAFLDEMHFHEGDIVTLGSEAHPAIDERNGVPLPPMQELRLTVKSAEPLPLPGSGGAPLLHKTR